MGWFDDFKNGDTDTQTAPAPGAHTATVCQAKTGVSKAGNPLVIVEWQTTDYAHYWTSFHGTSGGARPHTKRLLDGLGIDVTQLASEEELDEKLSEIVGMIFTVAVTENGDFLNTAVIAQVSQPELPVNGPPGKDKQSVFDDDVPF